MNIKRFVKLNRPVSSSYYLILRVDRRWW